MGAGSKPLKRVLPWKRIYAYSAYGVYARANEETLAQMEDLDEWESRKAFRGYASMKWYLEREPWLLTQSVRGTYDCNQGHKHTSRKKKNMDIRAACRIAWISIY